MEKEGTESKATGPFDPQTIRKFTRVSNLLVLEIVRDKREMQLLDEADPRRELLETSISDLEDIHYKLTGEKGNDFKSILG